MMVTPAHAVTLVGTSASLIDPTHPQVETDGGDQAHLLNIVTPEDEVNTLIDADVLLADNTPLVMTWRRDSGDAPAPQLALAIAMDGEPRFLQLRLKRPGFGPPYFAEVGDISTNGSPILSTSKLVVLRFDDPIDPLTDLLIGDVVTPTAFEGTVAWTLDIHNMLLGEEFDLILQAGLPTNTGENGVGTMNDVTTSRADSDDVSDAFAGDDTSDLASDHVSRPQHAVKSKQSLTDAESLSARGE